jgi:ribosomal protein S5
MSDPTLKELCQKVVDAANAPHSVAVGFAPLDDASTALGNAIGVRKMAADQAEYAARAILAALTEAEENLRESRRGDPMTAHDELRELCQAVVDAPRGSGAASQAIVKAGFARDDCHRILAAISWYAAWASAGRGPAEWREW